MPESQPTTPTPVTPVFASELTFNDGTALPLRPDEVVVFVGANNVGKSQALRDIGRSLQIMPAQTSSHKMLDAATTWTEDKEWAVQWFDQNVPKKQTANGLFYESRQHRAPVDSVVQDLRSGAGINGRTGKLVGIYVNAEDRVALTRGTRQIDLVENQPDHPLHILAGNASSLDALSSHVEQAFGLPLTLDMSSGNTIGLRVGLPSVQADHGRHGVASPEFTRALRELPLLDDQGLGIRSYTGLAMELLAGSHPIILVDEPEAFLHPPQAERIGRTIGELRTDSSQVFVATHDANVLKGFLSGGGAERTTVVRVQRSNDVNPVSVLSPEALKGLWSDPSLKYSNVLDGVFSEGVVICEGDPDCRLYESAMDAIDDSGSDGVHFTHGGGLGRIPVITAALTAVTVPCCVIVDTDVLGNRDLLRRIVESKSEQWVEGWEPLLNTLDSGVQTLAQQPTKATVQAAVHEALEDVNDEDTVPADSLKRIQSVASKASGWKMAKRGGRSVLPGGACVEAFDEMRNALAIIGIFVLEVGELERWFPTVGNHGPAHVAEVQAQELVTSASGAELRNLVNSVREVLLPSLNTE